MATVPFKLRDGSWFEIAGGTVVGTEHQEMFLNNQDSFTWGDLKGEHPAFVAVVTDGCGNDGRGANEVGAHMASHMVKRAILEAIKFVPGALQPTKDEFWLAVRDRHIDAIADSFAYMGDINKSTEQNLEETITGFGLFTVNGVVITPYVAVFFSIGDGVLALNGEPQNLGAHYGRKPAYPMLRKIMHRTSFKETELAFTLNYELDLWGMDRSGAAQFDSFLIGTDGVKDLVYAHEQKIPGVEQKVGPLKQFWAQDEYFKQETAITKKLRLINRVVTTPVLDTVKSKPFARIKREQGLLPDDTTFIVGRRVYPDGKKQPMVKLKD